MFQELNIENFNENVFHKIGKQWMLISAETDNECNAMTASWGGMGVLWGTNVAYIFVRPQRFSKHIIDESNHFALTFFNEEHRSMLAYMGKVSGKDEDKIATSNLHVIHDHAPYFEEAETVMICRKLYAQELDPECFVDGSLDRKWYPEKDYHTMYVAEIEKILYKK